MATLKEILADKTKYSDNLVWNLENGVAITIGQLRSLDDEKKAAVTKQEADLLAARTKLETDRKALEQAQLNTTTAYTTLMKVQEALKAGNFNDPLVKELLGNFNPSNLPSNGGGNDPFAALSRLENDTIIGPVVQVIKLVRDEAQKAQAAVAKNIETQKAMATNYMNGVLEDRYDRIVPADKQEKVTLKSLIEDAVRNNEFSSDSVPDIRRAYKRAVAGEVAADHDAKVAADAVEKFKKDQAEKAAASGTGGSDIFVATPNSNFGLDVHNRSGAAPKPFKSLDEAFAAAAKDKDIWANVDGTLQ